MDEVTLGTGVAALAVILLVVGVASVFVLAILMIESRRK